MTTRAKAAINLRLTASPAAASITGQCKIPVRTKLCSSAIINPYSRCSAYQYKSLQANRSLCRLKADGSMLLSFTLRLSRTPLSNRTPHREEYDLALGVLRGL